MAATTSNRRDEVMSRCGTMWNGPVQRIQAGHSTAFLDIRFQRRMDDSSGIILDTPYTNVAAERMAGSPPAE